jgi:hypothetical protein
MTQMPNCITFALAGDFYHERPGSANRTPEGRLRLCWGPGAAALAGVEVIMVQSNFSEPAPTAVWACRSRFCRHRGPFWARSIKTAKVDASKHRAQKFLGLWGHDVVVRPAGGPSFIEFLRQMRLAPKAAGR